MSPTDGASLSGIAEGADGMAMERVVTLIRPVVVFPSQATTGVYSTSAAAQVPWLLTNFRPRWACSVTVNKSTALRPVVG